MIVIGRGSVQQHECDVMGHMNVRHYIARIGDAFGWLALALGLPPSREDRVLAPADQHLRFLREMAPGTPFTIRGGVVGSSGDALRCFAEIRNTASGEPAATCVTDLACIDPRDGAPRPLPAEVAARMAPLQVEVPAHAAPRGLGFAPPAALPDATQAAAMGLSEAYRGAVRAEECDRHGMMRPDGVIARVWDGVPNLRNRGDGAGIREEGMGSAALEYRLVYLRPLRAGQLVTVTSGLRSLGAKTTTWTHLLHDGETGAPVAAAEAVGVAFDLASRKAIDIPPGRRAALEALLVPGLGL